MRAPRISSKLPDRALPCGLSMLFTLFFATPCLSFDLQGHRGARGLMPENTLPAFRKALALGVSTIETDLAVTRDGILVLSHNPALNPDITRGPDGQWLVNRGPAIFTLTLDELESYDIGRINPATAYARQFNSQTPIDGTRFPTLDELFDLVRAADRSPRLNIEIKTSPLRPQDTPDPEPFAQLVVASVRASGLADRVTVQSFDWRALMITKQLDPTVVTSCLTSQSLSMDTVSSSGGVVSPWLAGLDPRRYSYSVPRLAKAADCRIWSPDFKDLTAENVAEAHALGLKVLPWTVDSISDIQRVIALHADGLITDYPDRALPVIRSSGLTVQ
jgi:glycerophosphoryl diester phosphodiesterase